ncbi:ABC transporter permease [Chitinophaga sancti]|uniref:ABC transporter permease n=1 Tax=Chitinophaga sancti TaxID=1004 RepID=A0A1K1PFF8_9BACT|nr:ABC transporter permease [Chitinophaga sancti]WQD65840.1 ABC transporter permease [Chitinophaga sancti]WQG88538.1 ABC transporter permease [Chitinophaga sancti]SFW46225.1 putative ABC transport system permease protein [Chitinophaga sancti]
MLDRNFNNLYIALDSLGANRLRSFLTALGIIFGVSAVIAMLAIGKGAQEEILNQMKLVGVNNIVIKPKSQEKKDNTSNNSDQKEPESKPKFSKGLSLADAMSIRRILPTVVAISPEMLLEQDVIYGSKSSKLKVVGVEPAFFDINNIRITTGSGFNEKERIEGDGVCVIGSDVKRKFFISEDPLGKTIKCGTQWLKIIGVTEEKMISSTTKENLGIRDYNMDIYVPIQTMLVRFKNPSLYLGKKDGEDNSEDRNKSPQIFHQLDQLVIQVNDADNLSKSAGVINRMLKRRHNDVSDFDMTIPEQLLKQQQKTKDVFNIVLSAIAGISLLVGGIGIMNIMLASVLERTREIGIRMALGAQKKDIVMQFLFESVLISLSGGIIGVLLGVSGAYLVDRLAEIHTIISPFSIFISFMLASAVGLIFGISPARKAAHKNPIECLRHD